MYVLSLLSRADVFSVLRCDCLQGRNVTILPQLRSCRRVPTSNTIELILLANAPPDTLASDRAFLSLT